MGVGEEEENFFDLTFLEEIWKEFHGVGADAADAVVRYWVVFRVMGPVRKGRVGSAADSID